MIKLLMTLVTGVNLNSVDVELADYAEFEECEDNAMLLSDQYYNLGLDFIWECKGVSK